MLQKATSAQKSNTIRPSDLGETRSPNHQGLVQLGRYLRDAGYQHTAVTPLTHSYNNQRADNTHARNLRDVLGWSRPFERNVVSPEVFELMHDAGVLSTDGTLWRSSIRWARLRHLLCAHTAYPTTSADAVFFGPDTYRFAQFIESYLQRHPAYTKNIKRAADLGCGSGAGALLIAEACPSAQVLAVDINPKALQLTSVNAALAGAARVEPVYSNLLENARGEFDLIVANPPYMLDSQKRAYRHGGGKLGEGLSKQIIAAALERLAPGGTLLLYTGVAIVDGEDPFLTALKQQLHNEPCRWTYYETDPDVFSDELLKPAYVHVERIAAVCLALTRHPV